MHAYKAMIRGAATKLVAWYVVPADNQEFRKLWKASALGLLD
jgi:polyphosphate kinase 2 (PPK2 family)